MITAPRFGSVDAKFNLTNQPAQAALGGLLRMFSNKMPAQAPQPYDPENDRLAAEAFGIPQGQPSQPMPAEQSLLFPNAAPRRIYGAR
jgi:hypothetical protein